MDMTRWHMNHETLKIAPDGMVVLTDAELIALERDFSVGSFAGGLNDRCTNDFCDSGTNSVCTNNGCTDRATNSGCLNNACRKLTSEDQ
jgi:hypothetical protein